MMVGLDTVTGDQLWAHKLGVFMGSPVSIADG